MHQNYFTRLLTRFGLVALLVLLANVNVKAYRFIDNGIYYNIVSSTKQTVEVTLGDELYSGTVEIPSTAEYKNKTYTVVSVGVQAFWNCTDLQEVILPPTLTKIDWYAFAGCTDMESINLPEGVTSIGDFAFLDCTALTDVSLSQSLTTINIHAFEGCSALSNIVIPDNVTTIASDAFTNCTALTEITLSGSMETLGDRVFVGCTALEEITIPESVKTVGNQTFAGCTALRKINFPSALERIGNDTFAGCTALESITLPNSVTYIGIEIFADCTALYDIKLSDSLKYIDEFAFSNCTALTGITLPESLTGLGTSAFWNCTALKEITLPSSLTEIGGGSFVNCFSLTDIFVSDENTAFTSVDGVLYNKELTELWIYPAGKTATSFNIPETVTKIGNYSFSNCVNLNELIMPSGLTEIGWRALSECEEIESVTCKALEVPTLGYRSLETGREQLPVLYVENEVIEDYKDSDWAQYFSEILPIEEKPGGDEDSVEITENDLDGYYMIYDLNGRFIKKTEDISTVRGLDAGVYIINGKKIYIK